MSPYILPTVSIITPSYNQALFLKDTLVSIEKQDYPHVENIVIDGGSTDGSVDIINSYKGRLAYWISEKDSGQSHAINKGFARANGAILAWLNSDDLLAPSAAKIAARYLQKHPEVGLVYGDRLEIDQWGNVIGILQLPPHDAGMFRKGFTLPQETAFFRRELFEQVGGLDEHLHFAMDTDLWCKMAKIAPMMHIPAFLGCFRRHDSAKSVVYEEGAAKVKQRYEEEIALVMRRHFGCRPPSQMAMKWYRLQRYFRRWAYHIAGGRQRGLQEVWQAKVLDDGLGEGLEEKPEAL